MPEVGRKRGRRHDRLPEQRGQPSDIAGDNLLVPEQHTSVRIRAGDLVAASEVGHDGVDGRRLVGTVASDRVEIDEAWVRSRLDLGDERCVTVVVERLRETRQTAQHLGDERIGRVADDDEAVVERIQLGDVRRRRSERSRRAPC